MIRKRAGCGRLRANTGSWRMGGHPGMAAGCFIRGVIRVHLRPLQMRRWIRRVRRWTQIHGDAGRLEPMGFIGLPCNQGAKREVCRGRGIPETAFLASSRAVIPAACIMGSAHGRAGFLNQARTRREPAGSTLWLRRVRRGPFTQ